MNKQNLHYKFYDLAKNGDITGVVNLYNSNQPGLIEKIFKFFKLNISLTLDPHYECNDFTTYGSPFSIVCVNGHIEILDFFLKDSSFVNNIKEQPLKIITGLNGAIENNHLTIVKKLLPLIKNKNNEFYLCIYKTFTLACKYGNIEIIKYLSENIDLHTIVDQSPSISIKSLPLIYYGLTESIAYGHIELLNFLNSNIKVQDHQFNEHIINGFIHGCKNGCLNMVKYLLEDKGIIFNDSNLFYEDHYLRGYKTNPIMDGFNEAFTNANLNIIKYFTSGEHHPFYVDIHNINKNYPKVFSRLILLEDKHKDIIRYFIFDLNLRKEECFFLIPEYADYFFTKKESYDELNSEIEINSIQKNDSIKKKRLKI